MRVVLILLALTSIAQGKGHPEPKPEPPVAVNNPQIFDQINGVSDSMQAITAPTIEPPKIEIPAVQTQNVQDNQNDSQTTSIYKDDTFNVFLAPLIIDTILPDAEFYKPDQLEDSVIHNVRTGYISKNNRMMKLIGDDQWK